MGDKIKNALSVIATISLLSSLFFLSNNVTGSVIGNSGSNSNWVGGILFAIGLIAALFYYRKKS